MDKVRYLYLRHTKDSNHVVTVVRVIDGDQVRFAWAANKQHDKKARSIDPNLRSIMTRQEFLELKKRWRRSVQRDNFCKRTGREIALGRLERGVDTMIIPYEEGKISYNIVKFLADAEAESGVPHWVNLIARGHLYRWLSEQSIKTANQTAATAN